MISRLMRLLSCGHIAKGWRHVRDDMLLRQDSHMASLPLLLAFLLPGRAA